MWIRVQCPSCGKSLKGPNELAGKRVKCPKCDKQFKLPPLPPSPNTRQSVADDLMTKLEAEAHELNRLKCFSCGTATLNNASGTEPRKVLTFPTGDEGFICGRCAYYDRDPDPNRRHWTCGSPRPQFGDPALIVYINFWSARNLIAALQQLSTRNVRDNPNYWKDIVQLPLNKAAEAASTFHWSGLEPSSSSSRVSSSVQLEDDHIGISLAETHRDGSCMWQLLDITRLSNQLFGLQLTDNLGEDGGYRVRPFSADNFLWRGTVVFL